MGRGRDVNEGSPMDPGEARTAGYDPDAVEVHRKGTLPTTRGGRRLMASAPTSTLQVPASPMA